MSKKILALVLALILCAALLTGCPASEKEIDTAKLYNSLKSDLAFKDELIDMEMSAILNYYFFDDANVIEEALVCKSASGATAEEIAVITVKSVSDVESVKAAVEMRVEDLAFNFENYVPAEMDKIENAVVATSGRYIILAVADDSAAAQEIIDSYIK
ncbi:MAG: DUF4358 domain-containing protein [Oscillospiraceae bacterium]|nr:DUF4358 domain-containing protein [Oscillospiraceae bacterium]